MSNVFNTTLISSDNNYFDPMDYIDQMPIIYVAAVIGSAIAWRIDADMVGNSRSLLRLIKDEQIAQGKIDSIAELMNALREQEFAEQCFEEAGSVNPGLIEDIRWLNAQRDQWNEFALRLTSMCSDYRSIRQHEVHSVDNLFEQKMATTVPLATQNKLRVHSQQVAKALGMDDAADHSLALALEAAKNKRVNMSSTLYEQRDVARTMLHLALRSDPSSAQDRSGAFYTMPAHLQRKLLNAACQAAQRAGTTAADDRAVSETEYMMISTQSVKAMLDFQKVLKSPRFTALAVEPASI